MGLADAPAQDERVPQFGVGEVELPTLVERVQQSLVEGIPALVPEADQIQRSRGHQFKLLVRCDPCCKLLGEFDVSADVVSQSLHPVVPDHKPELERPEASPQRDLPVAVINDGSRCGRLVAQIFG